MSDTNRVPVDLGAARILVSNDDGIAAEGIKVLATAIRDHVAETRVIAPDAGRSGASHMISINRSLNLSKLGDAEFMIDGTPADAAMVGIQRVYADGAPDLVLSGVNHGYNLGDDFFSSGTIGVAIEACLQHVPAIAFSTQSSYGAGKPENWETVARVIPEVTRRLCQFGFERDIFYNVNIPNLPYDEIKGIVAAPQGRMDSAPSFEVEEVAMDGRGGDDDRVYRLRHMAGVGLRAGKSDYTAVRGGYVAVTPIRVVISADEAIDALDHAIGAALPQD